MEEKPPTPERRKLKGGRRATDRLYPILDDAETRKQLIRMKTLLHELVDVVQALTAKRRRP